VRGEACQALLALTLVLLTSRDASAEQRQDFMLDVQPEGTSVYLDYFFTGAQLTLEHRESIYDNANDVSVAAVALGLEDREDELLAAHIAGAVDTELRGQSGELGDGLALEFREIHGYVSCETTPRAGRHFERRRDEDWAVWWATMDLVGEMTCEKN
jgi:hypothetical protein